ncbi:MAG: hypothetical protein IPM31_12265 [Anaerolineae bacterium]|jgi:hypothetical protein|nr:hypothetical protein [Anaerolineae bacterium]MBL8106814.1 hypothetical protein [Anaerolineales bacterium]MCC7188160.1 hypothetical protein [Anaerolineales bacterium]
MNNKKFSLLVAVLMLAMLVLQACASKPSANFPTGRFANPEAPLEGFDFHEDGTWNNFYYGAHEVWGTYSVKGDLYIEETNNFNCGKSPMSFRYTFDGTNLHFELTEESKNDECEGRRGAFDGTTWVLVEE